jgi:haloalkane dehalogenase
MIEATRAPEARFADLPGFPYAARYRDVDGLRLAHLDEGDGPPVLLVHGEPTWSYLWRHVIPPLRDAGFRCVVPDHAGFGRSDKPADLSWYSYDRHTALLTELVERLDLRDATVVVHDWGGPIGLRVAAEHPDRISRIVAMDTGLFTGHQKMSDAWQLFRDFVERTEDLPIGMLVRGGCHRDPGDDVIAAYEARLPADDPAHAPGPGRRRRTACARRARRGPAPEARAVGRQRPDHPAGDGEALRRGDRERAGARDP